MNIKSYVLLCICLFIVLTTFSSCDRNKKEDNGTANNITSLKFHPQNIFTAEDKNYIYYIDTSNIYRVSRKDNKSQVMLQFQPEAKEYSIENYMIIHKHWLYYDIGDSLYKLNTENGINIKLNSYQGNISDIQCDGNVLYVFVQKEQNGLKVYNITNDSDQLILEEQYKISAYPNVADAVIRNGWKYYQLGMNNSHLFAEKIDGSYQAAILNLSSSSKSYLITDSYIYFLTSAKDSSGISELWRYDSLHGGRKVGQLNMPFVWLTNFDTEWIYYYSGNSDKLSNIYKVQFNGKREQLVKNLPENYIHFDIVDNWIYLIRSDGTVSRMKTNGSNYQTEPF